MLIFERDEQQFFVSLTYIGASQAFVMFLMIPTDIETASKYRATISLQEPNSNSPLRHSYVVKVLSIDELKNIGVAEIPSSKCLIVTSSEAERFLSVKPNDDDDYNTVHLPFYIDNILKEDD